MIRLVVSDLECSSTLVQIVLLVNMKMIKVSSGLLNRQSKLQGYLSNRNRKIAFETDRPFRIH